MLRFKIGTSIATHEAGEFVRYTEHEAEVSAWKDACETFKKDRDEANAAHEVLKAELETTRSWLRVRDGQLAGVEKELAEVTKDRDKANAAHDAVKADFERAQAVFGSTERALGTVRRERNGLYNDMASLKSEHNALMTAHNKVMREHYDFKAALEAIAGGVLFAQATAREALNKVYGRSLKLVLNKRIEAFRK